MSMPGRRRDERRIVVDVIGRLQRKRRQAGAHAERVVDVVHLLLPVDDLAARFDGRVIGIRIFAARLPVEQVLLELVVRDLDPVLDEILALFAGRERRLRELPLDLGDVDLLAGRVHQEVDRIEHAELERQLLVLLDRVVIVGFRAVADPPRRPVDAVGQHVADAFAPDDPVEQPEEPPLVVGRHSGQVRVGQDAGFVAARARRP